MKSVVTRSIINSAWNQISIFNYCSLPLLYITRSIKKQHYVLIALCVLCLCVGWRSDQINVLRNANCASNSDQNETSRKVTPSYITLSGFQLRGRLWDQTDKREEVVILPGQIELEWATGNTSNQFRDRWKVAKWNNMHRSGAVSYTHLTLPTKLIV